MRNASVVLLLVGILGWVASDATGATGKSRTASKVSKDTVLVRIGAETITSSVVQKRLEELPEQVRANYLTPDGRQRFLERLVEERIWLMTALKNGVAERPDVKRQIDQQRRDLLIRTYVNEVMAARSTPADSEAQVYYNEHTSDYKVPATVTVSHIQAKTEADAKRVKQWTRNQDWKKLAAKYSTDSLTRGNGGALGSVTREGVFGSIGPQPALAESAFALKAGAIAGPIQTNKGWHVIKVDEVKPESVRPFEQVKPLIVRQLSSKQAQDFYQIRLEAARKALNVRPDSSAIKNFVSQKRSARDLFNDAQAAGAPTARVAAYRRLLEEYPNSEVSPQAQFMIGFIYSEELKDFAEAEKAFKELLARYPKSELAASAQWMVEHMRTEDAPSFMNLEADTSADAAGGVPKKGSSDKP